MPVSSRPYLGALLVFLCLASSTSQSAPPGSRGSVSRSRLTEGELNQKPSLAAVRREILGSSRLDPSRLDPATLRAALQEAEKDSLLRGAEERAQIRALLSQGSMLSPELAIKLIQKILPPPPPDSRSSGMERPKAGKLLSPSWRNESYLHIPAGKSIPEIEKLLAGNTADTILVESLEDTNRIRSLAAKYDKLLLLDNSTSPLRGLRVLNRIPKRVSIIHDMPQSPDHAKVIHGSNKIISEASLASIRKMAYDNISLDQNLAERLIDLSDLKYPSKKLIGLLRNSTEDDLFVIIGHNNNGVLMLHDDSGIKLNELESARATLIIVSCNSAVHASATGGMVVGMKAEISYPQAFTIAQHYINSHRKLPARTRTMKKLLKEIQAIPEMRISVGVLASNTFFIQSVGDQPA